MLSVFTIQWGCGRGLDYIASLRVTKSFNIYSNPLTQLSQRSGLLFSTSSKIFLFHSTTSHHCLNYWGFELANWFFYISSKSKPSSTEMIGFNEMMFLPPCGSQNQVWLDCHDLSTLRLWDLKLDRISLCLGSIGQICKRRCQIQSPKSLMSIPPSVSESRDFLVTKLILQDMELYTLDKYQVVYYM